MPFPTGCHFHSKDTRLLPQKHIPSELQASSHCFSSGLESCTNHHDCVSVNQDLAIRSLKSSEAAPYSTIPLQITRSNNMGTQQRQKQRAQARRTPCSELQDTLAFDRVVSGDIWIAALTACDLIESLIIPPQHPWNH